MNIPESRWRSAVPGPHRLHRLTLAAIRRAPQGPVFRIADGVAGIPELRSNPAEARIFQHADFLAVLNLPSNLSGKLKLVSPVINRPRTIGLHQNSVVGALNQIVKIPSARQQTHIGHANNRQTVPALGPHGARGTFQPNQMRRLAIRKVTAELSRLDNIRALRGHTLIVIRKSP